jgi:diguanylate cyclase
MQSPGEAAMSGNAGNAEGAPENSPARDNLIQSSRRDTELNRIHNQLKKTILKLVFSFAGIDPDIDDEIAKLKNNLRHAGSEDERRIIIEKSVEVILTRSEKLRAGFTSANSKTTDYFPEFLNRLSLPDDLNDEILSIREQAQKNQQQQQYLELIDKTVKLICTARQTDEDSNKYLINLLEHLVLPREAMQELNRVREQISLNQISSMKSVNQKITSIINGVHEQLQKELDDIQRYLNKLIAQLSALYRHLEATQREQGISCMEAEALNRDFHQQNDLLHQKMDEAQSLDELKACVDAQMAKLETALDEHLTTERQRQEAADQRAAQLKHRLQEMESESLNLKEKLNEVHLNAHRDALTGIPNRLAYDEQLKKEIARSQRYRQPLTLALIDIDDFKKVNDRFGHKAGDKVLKAVATVCNENVREADFLARYGGEEFALLLPETDGEEAAIAVENLRHVVERCNFHHHNQSVPITISIGYAEFKMNEHADEVFHRADMALYSAKNMGRNRCVSELEATTSAA